MRIVLVSLLALVAAGCGPSVGSKGKTSVVAAFYPLAFVAQRIGGPKVDVTNLTPAGAEPHDIELSPGDVARIQIQPRGGFTHAISVNTAVKRLIHTVDPDSGNRKIFVGMSIMTISAEHKANFTDLLRTIVIQMRS